MHGKTPMGNIQKLNRFENPRNELIVAYPSGRLINGKWLLTPTKSGNGKRRFGAFFAPENPQNSSNAGLRRCFCLFSAPRIIRIECF
jgi:hypothetical protein